MKKYLTPLNIVILIIFVTAFALRVWGIDKHPVGFTQDEAALGYDAYSLLDTGKDQWGNVWPLVLRSFGDFKLPLYSYLTIPSVAVFGLNEFATRLPNAILGFLAVVATFFVVSEMTKNKRLAVLSAFFLALSPWHISLSRGAFEANLTAFFMTVGVWAFLKGLNNKRWMIVSSLFFGLNLFSYHSARLVTPLIYLLTVVVFYAGKVKLKSLIKFTREFKLAFFVFVIFFGLAVGTMFFGGGKRGVDILITNPTDKWQSVSDRRYDATLLGLPDHYARIFNNKASYSLKLFYSNYLSYLSPDFLFTQGAGEWSYGMIPGRGVLYSFELITIIAAFIAFNKGKTFKGFWFILFWIFIAIIPAALTKGPGHAANRAAVMIPAVQVLSAFGALSIYTYISGYLKTKLIKPVYFYLLTFLVFISAVFFFEDYIYHQPVQAVKSMQVANKDIVTQVLNVDDKYSQIMVSRSLSVPQIWVSFTAKWDPLDHQMQSRDWLKYEEEGHLYIDQFDGYSLGKYTFGSLDIEAYKNKENLLLVGKPEEFPSNVHTLFTSNYPDGTVAFQAVESEALK